MFQSFIKSLAAKMDYTISILDISIAIALSLIALYYYLTKHFNYWKRYNVAGPRPIPVFGNFKDVILGKLNRLDLIENAYNAYPDEPVVGLFVMRQPILLVRDLDIFKDVVIQNFSIFADRGLNVIKEVDPLNENIVFMKPDKWRPWRKCLAPVFTAGKLKNMFYLVNECAQNFENYLWELVKIEKPVECQQLTAKYTINVIGSCVFGLNINTFSDKESEFLKYGKVFFDDNWKNRLLQFSRQWPRWLALIFKPFIRNEELIQFFVNSFKTMMEQRRENNIRRNDFVDVLMDTKDNPEKLNTGDISDMEITAQAFAFFAAGFETSSNTLSHALYEMALNPDVQRNLRDEINSSFQENGGKLSFDTVKGLPYLDKVLKETLRKYPVIPVITRRAMRDHVLDGSEILIKNGMMVMISVYSLHRDPKYYPDPERFDPERFSEEAIHERHPMSYAPFGEGPRNCIGERFAQIQTKLGLVYLIRNFKFDVCEKTSFTYEKLPNTGLLVPKGGIHLKISTA